MPQSSTDIGEPLLSDTWISLFGGAGGVVIRLQEGGGSWRLIGNRAPVNVNGNQGFVQPWLTLYTDPSTQDKLALAVTLLAPLPYSLHPLKGKEDRHKRGKKKKLWDTIGIPRENKRRNVWHFKPSSVLLNPSIQNKLHATNQVVFAYLYTISEPNLLSVKYK